MSLILDALRKSEAERRRGQSPDLYAELPPPSRRAAKRMLPWQWLALAAGIAGHCRLGRTRGTERRPGGCPQTPFSCRCARLRRHRPDSIRDGTVIVLGDGASTPPVTMPHAPCPGLRRCIAPATSTMTPIGFTPAPVGPATPDCPCEKRPCDAGPGEARPALVEAPVVAACPRRRQIRAKPSRRRPRRPGDRSTARAGKPGPGRTRAPASPRPPRRCACQTSAPRSPATAAVEDQHAHVGPGVPRSASPSSTARVVTEGDRIGPAVVDEISADGVVWPGTDCV
jgi:general secretion pathway protein B